ncbi:MAG: hypothetical protein HYY06_01540 [Deltaproteobacteria bacterium]|nr:hypothetical protein [Deltaproteobacteria bacterium]
MVRCSGCLRPRESGPAWVCVWREGAATLWICVHCQQRGIVAGATMRR